jgi:3'(2'), 5'-bisphosphate nucleotidase
MSRILTVLSQEPPVRAVREKTADEELADSLAYMAGELLTSMRVGGASIGSLGPNLAERGLNASRELLVSRLEQERPDDFIVADPDRELLPLDLVQRVWILDPLDGMDAFGCPPRSDWTVNLALWERGRGITAAAIAQPDNGGIYSAADGLLPPSPAVGPRILLVDHEYAPSFASAVGKRVGASLHEMGSVGARTLAVLRGDADGYLHSGAGPVWDTVPLTVARSAGLTVVPLESGRPDRTQTHRTCTDHLVCTPEMSGPLLDALGWVAASG